MADESGRSTLRDKGQITLPAAVRKALHVDPGDDVEFEVVAGGAVLMRGLKLIPADQAWFWTESWQAGEEQASRDVAEHRSEVFKDDESFLGSLRR